VKKEQDKSAIYLVGYRASGKTSAGRAVASELSRLFVDTDRLVEESEGRAIASIFAESGEPVFRRLESEALAAVGTRVLEGERLVVATGGGIVLSRENVERMSSTGYVVWLRAPASVLQDRIERDPASARTRPALSGESAVAEVAEVLERRYSLYEAAADCVVDTGDLDEEQVCGAVLEAITELPK